MAKKIVNEEGESVPTPTIEIPPPKEPKTITINAVYSMLNQMPLWPSLGVEIKDSEPYVDFTRGNVTIRIPYIEVVILGAKTIYNMFKCMDQ
jgi:hypothetical protein